MIPASPSPSSVAAVSWKAAAGPLQIDVTAPPGRVAELIAANFGLYDVAWPEADRRAVRLQVSLVEEQAAAPAEGRYLVCAQMLVDPGPGGLRATTRSGAILSGRLKPDGDEWELSLPMALVEAAAWPEIEDTLSLVLTTGWRRCGWVPMHGGGLTDGSRGAIVCATSGGGKTTFTLAMVRRGWRSVGDDKLLLSMSGRPRLIGLTSSMNIDPAAAAWFPELHGVAELPEYSAWTPKRRVPIGRLWPQGSAQTMAPTVLFELERRGGRGGIVAERLERADRIATLMRQTVIPSDRTLAAAIIRAIVGCAEQSSGFRLVVHDDAYTQPAYLDRVQDLLA